MHNESFVVECSYSFTDKCLASTSTKSIPSNGSTHFIIPRGESALYVLEVAASVDRRFQFSITYGILGYSIKTINDVENNDDCKWKFYMASKALFQPFSPLGFSVDTYIIPFSKDVNVDITVGFLYGNTSQNTAEKKEQLPAAYHRRNFKVYMLLCTLIVTTLLSVYIFIMINLCISIMTWLS